MNRRTMIKALCAIPIVGGIAAKYADKPKTVIRTITYRIKVVDNFTPALENVRRLSNGQYVCFVRDENGINNES